MFRRRTIFHRTRHRRRSRSTTLTKHYRTNRTLAKAIITHKVHQWNELLGFRLGRITIRNQRSRWGSCSAYGNLNFNYKLIFLPERLLDYVIVHELCHLQELNHSPAFWSLVADIMPEYPKYIKELRQYERNKTLCDTYLEQYRSIVDIKP